jgi:hypothetical protein
MPVRRRCNSFTVRRLETLRDPRAIMPLIALMNDARDDPTDEVRRYYYQISLKLPTTEQSGDGSFRSTFR